METLLIGLLILAGAALAVVLGVVALIYLGKGLVWLIDRVSLSKAQRDSIKQSRKRG